MHSLDVRDFRNKFNIGLYSWEFLAEKQGIRARKILFSHSQAEVLISLEQ